MQMKLTTTPKDIENKASKAYKSSHSMPKNKRAKKEDLKMAKSIVFRIELSDKYYLAQF